MKRQFVQNLQEGEQINDYFVAVRKDLRTQQKGGKFLGMVFKDRTGEIGGIMWNNAASVAKLFDLGDVVQVRGTVTSYQDRLQIRVDQVLPLREGEFEHGDLVYVPDDADEVISKFVALLKTIKDPYLRQLVESFLGDEGFMNSFAAAAAGKRWHHAYAGGLVRHCYEMARLAEVMHDLFPDLDRDLLLTGILLHDAGKMEEMSQELVVEYTTAGRLVGHLALGVILVQERINQIEGFPEKMRLELMHLILSHHGEMANGAPILPKTLEAIVLHHIDNLDAQADAFSRIIAEAKDRGQAWSDYISMIDRPIWTKLD